MTREQLLATIIVLGVLAGAIQQFYLLKSEVDAIHIRLDYLTGTNWQPPQEAK